MKFSKKILAAVLAALMAISMMPITVFATTYDSSKVAIDNLREGDIITTSVNKIIGLDEYSLTLQAGGYGSDGGNAENTDLRISWPEFSNGSVVDDEVGYYPFDENGNQSNTWYVVALDHSWDTITLSGIAPAPLKATFTGNLVDTFETGIMNKFIGGDELDYDTTTVQKDREYEISRGVDDYGLIVVVSVPGNAAFDPADISFTIGETVSRPVSDDDDDGSAAVWYYPPDENDDPKVYEFFVRKAAFTDSMVVDYTPSTPAEPATPAYGNYVVADGDNGAGLYDKEVYFNDMAWYVIEDNSTDTNAGSLTLLAKDAIGSSQFYTSKSSASDMSYNGSTVKAYLDGLTAEGGAFEDVADAILPTTLTTYGYNSTDVYETTENAKLYLLSVSEASELPMRVKMLGGTAGKYWWLRSPGYYNDDGARVAYEVNYDVQASGEDPTTSYYVRPALNLDLSKVEFDSSSREFSILAEEEEASTVSFTKATSANDITAENIGTCTFAEAKAWILDNWVSVTNTQQYFVDVVYFDENGVFSVFFITPASMSKLGFNNDCNEADTSYTVDGIRGDVSSYGDDAWLCTPPAPAEPNNGSSITVAETISENFYLDDEFYGEDSFITVNYNHNSNVSETDDFRTDVVAMNSLPELDDSTSEYNGARKFSVVQAPAQITEEVTITVYASQADAQAGTNAIDTITTSTYDYCRAIIEGDYAANLKALAKSTLDYAAAAQLFFNYNTDEMATKDNANNAFYGDVAGADLSNVAGPGALATGIEQVSVVVKSDLEINLLSRNKINVTDYNLDTTKGGTRFKATSVEEKNGDFYVIHIEGIEPENMDNMITVNTDCGDIVMTANSVMKAMAGSSDEKMVTLAKAMYLYGVAANNYFA